MHHKNVIKTSIRDTRAQGREKEREKKKKRHSTLDIRLRVSFTGSKKKKKKRRRKRMLKSCEKTVNLKHAYRNYEPFSTAGF